MLDFSKRKIESGKPLTFYLGNGMEEPVDEIGSETIYEDASPQILEKYGFKHLTNEERDEYAKIYMKSLSILITSS